MLGRIFEKYGIYGDEEESFRCEDLFSALSERILDNETDLQTVMRYLLEKTDFLDWIEDTYHNVEKSEQEECEHECEAEYEQMTMFNAQAEILKETQEELKKLKKKYNVLLNKYKDMKGSL